jgi:Protein of unknown function (DUF2917)
VSRFRRACGFLPSAGWNAQEELMAVSPFVVAEVALLRRSELLERPRRTTPTHREDPQLQVALGVTRAWSFEVGRQSMRIQVLEGEVMVTFEGDPVDHVLAQGAVFTTSRRGRVAVAAFRPSRFSITGA